jgi:hypothetical protein
VGLAAGRRRGDAPVVHPAVAEFLDHVDPGSVAGDAA